MKKAGKRVTAVERAQGVAKTQVFGMKGQNWVRLVKTSKFNQS
jgi:hypothetical protein